jgi:rubredoxin
MAPAGYVNINWEGKMKKYCLWTLLTAFSWCFCITGSAMAAWVEVNVAGEDVRITTTINGPLTQAEVDVSVINEIELIEYTLEVKNVSDENIEGSIRIFVEATGFEPLPANISTMDDGTAYYDVEAGQIDLIEPDESVKIPVYFTQVTASDSENIIYPDFDNLTFIPYLNDASLTGTIFRKKISKTPEFYSGEAKIAVIPRYVQARNTNGDPVQKKAGTSVFTLCDDEGTTDKIETCDQNNFEGGTVTLAKPIVVIYLQEIDGTYFNNVPDYDADGDPSTEDGKRLAHDVYAAVSLDAGATWKRKNISKTSTKSSYLLPNGVEYPGDSESPDLAVADNKILVTWMDKYCRSGNPWGITDADDIYQVKGSQNEVDYEDVTGDDDPRPDLGIRPFSCIMASRGVLQLEDPDADVQSESVGTVVWYNSEQLSTGRRDAARVFPAAEDPASGAPGGFAVTWQEDPKGLKTGKGRGPGAGMSGAGVNHKTDIWYSYIGFDAFDDIDEDFVPTANDPDVEYDEVLFDVTIDEDDTVPMPHAELPFSPPVRLTDNAVCKDRTKSETVTVYVHDEEHSDCNYSYEEGSNANPEDWSALTDAWVCPKCGLPSTTFVETTEVKKAGAPYCDDFLENSRVDGDGNAVDPGLDPFAYDGAFFTTNEGEPLDGNTGASRANLSLVNWKGQTLAIVAYEETKGIGVGGDKEAAAMEQTAPFPLYHLTDADAVFATYKTGEDDNGNPILEDYTLESYGMTEGYLGGFTNKDCRSCHYDNIVPKDRLIPMATEADCAGKGGTWDTSIEAYYPYTGYAYSSVDPSTQDMLSEAGVTINNPKTETPRLVQCIKFPRGKEIYPRDYAQTVDGALYILPDSLPGWHNKGLDCTKCHLPYDTKNVDGDTVLDRYDKCIVTIEAGETVEQDSTSDRYGCADDQDPSDQDNNKDMEPRYRHGKNIYYHSFAYDTPDVISHGAQINIPNQMGWVAPGTQSKDENARRVRVVPNPIADPDDPESLTLGLLYKMGKDGQGAPADAFIRFFRGGYSIENIDDEGEALNLSSSTPYIFGEDVTEPGEVDSGSADGSNDTISSGHKTPKIENYYWTEENLLDSSGYWVAEDGEKTWTAVDGTDIPTLDHNPFDNVFSTRLVMYGDFVGVGFAYSTNWAAAKKAKDHYDFFIRTSDDAGKTWTLPVNVSELKNNKESVSDCRLILPPDTLYPVGSKASDYYQAQYGIMPRSDWHNDNALFVAIGTKENTPQPAPNQTELEESEIFLDVTYSRSLDRGQTFEGVFSDNPNFEPSVSMPCYDNESQEYVEYTDSELMDCTPNAINETYSSELHQPYIDNLSGSPTAEQFDANDIENQPNPAFDAQIAGFDWIAKGDAFQGDVQAVTDPSASTLHAIWEQELAIEEDGSTDHFEGADTWYRKVSYGMSKLGDIDNNGIIDIKDVQAVMSYKNQLSAECPGCDIDGSKIINYFDARLLMTKCTYPRCASQ